MISQDAQADLLKASTVLQPSTSEIRVHCIQTNADRVFEFGKLKKSFETIHIKSFKK